MEVITSEGDVTHDVSDSLSECPFCGDDWFEAREDHFDTKWEAAPFFDRLVEVKEGPATLLARSVWLVKCYSCDESWVQNNLYSRLFKAEDAEDSIPGE